MKVITLQQAMSPDFTRPFPFDILENGDVLQQDFWKGSPLALVGFQADLAVLHVDLFRKDWWKDPQKAVGMYPVFVDSNEHFAVWLLAVETVAVREVIST